MKMTEQQLIDAFKKFLSEGSYTDDNDAIEPFIEAEKLDEAQKNIVSKFVLKDKGGSKGPKEGSKSDAGLNTGKKIGAKRVGRKASGGFRLKDNKTPKNEETAGEGETVAEDSTAAQATLKPGSGGGSYKSERIQKMAGAAASMTDDQWEKWFNEMMANVAATGTGQDIPDGAAAKNQATLKPHVKEAIASDVTKILSEEEGLSEDFKKKAATLFEAAVELRLMEEQAKLEEELDELYETQLNEAVEEIAEDIQKFLDFAADQWMTENAVAIEASLRNKIAEDFLTGLRKLVSENNVIIPEDQVDVVTTMSEKIDELETDLNDSIEENVQLRKALEEVERKQILTTATEGLTLQQSEKLKELAENLDFDTLDEFKTKVITIKESEFIKNSKPSTINESLESTDETNTLEENEKTFSSPIMKKYYESIKRQV